MTEGKDQAPAPETEPGPEGLSMTALRLYSPAAFAAMSVRCWEPSRRMRATAR
ncbi:hypothetical protein RKD23_003973 [Streptomyces sp. SAI-170]